MSAILAEADLSAIFGIELDTGAADVGAGAAAILSAVKCGKCSGTGKWVSYSGKKFPCFGCDGSGVDRMACVQIKEGDCAKCAGTGLWNGSRPCFACNATGKIAPANDAAITVDAIADAFAAARNSGIKAPKLRLDTFTFSRAPDTGRNAGAIYVKQDGEYLGKVTDGRFRPVRECDAPTTERVIAAAANPHESAKAYGAKTGSCSCCGRELTNGESIEIGIGPICRDKFGWG